MQDNAHFRTIFRSVVLTAILSPLAIEDSLGLERGWQLQLPPVEKLAAGTIYREDPEGRVYRVTTLSVPSELMEEGAIDYQTKATTSARALVQFLKLGEVHGELGKHVQVDIAIKHVIREITSDLEVDRAVAEFGDKVRIRRNHRYYIIRETRAATKIDVQLAEDVLSEVGGGISIPKLLRRALEAGTAIRREDRGSLVARGEYDKPMYIMFLPEEIRQISAGLAGRPPQFGRTPVDRTLDWQIEQTTE